RVLPAPGAARRRSGRGRRVARGGADRRADPRRVRGGLADGAPAGVGVRIVIERLASADEVPETGAPEAASRGSTRALRRSLGSVRAALAVLTRIPVADPGLVTGAPAFGLVGALIGVA